MTGRVNGAMEARGNCKENKIIHVFLCFFLSCLRKSACGVPALLAVKSDMNGSEIHNRGRGSLLDDHQSNNFTRIPHSTVSTEGAKAQTVKLLLRVKCGFTRRRPTTADYMFVQFNSRSCRLLFPSLEMENCTYTIAWDVNTSLVTLSDGDVGSCTWPT